MKAYHSHIIPCALLLLATGLFIRYCVGKRRFNRRGIAGMQQFPTYSRAVMITALERLILFIGNLSLLAGLLLLAVAGFNHFKF